MVGVECICIFPKRPNKPIQEIFVGEVASSALLCPKIRLQGLFLFHQPLFPLFLRKKGLSHCVFEKTFCDSPFSYFFFGIRKLIMTKSSSCSCFIVTLRPDFLISAAILLMLLIKIRASRIIFTIFCRFVCCDFSREISASKERA